MAHFGKGRVFKSGTRWVLRRLLFSIELYDLLQVINLLINEILSTGSLRVDDVGNFSSRDSSEFRFIKIWGVSLLQFEEVFDVLVILRTSDRLYCKIFLHNTQKV